MGASVMTNFDTDVLVLGAGPAGSALAQQLARAGFKVTLVDRKAFPREKPCGEFLSPQCRPYLVDLGVDGVLRALGTRTVHGMDLWRGERCAPGRLLALPGAPHGACGYAVRREVLDTELLRAACARPEVTWLERHEFRTALRAADGTVTGAVLRDPERRERAVRAAFVVGADGVRSRLAHELGLQRPQRWLDRLALVARFDGVPARDHAEVHFVDGGYFAATTVDDGTFHLNLVVDRARLRDGNDDLDAFVAARLQHAPVLQQRLRAAVRSSPWRGTGPLAFATRRQALAGAALVGDACGYVDPLTGEGIYFALHGARSLTLALTQARSAPRTAAAALRGYERRRRQEIAPRLWLAALLQRGLRHPAVVARVLAVLAARPAVADLLITLTGDCVHPRDLLRPAFWRQWRQARRAAEVPA